MKLPDQIADEFRSARVAARHAYINAEITRRQYEAQIYLINDLVSAHVRWYKSVQENFDELSFIGAADDGGAVL